MADPKYPVRRSNLHNVREQIGDHLVDVDDRVTALEGGTPLPSGTWDFIDFTTGIADAAYKEGRLFYDDLNQTLAFYNEEADIILQVGQELWMRVYNAGVSTIADGSAVSVVGLTAGGIPQITLTDANDKTLAQSFIGLTTHSIEASTYGYVTILGFVRNFDTSGLAAGSPMWVDPLVLGGLTTTEPQSPAWLLRAGGVAVSDATNGVVFSRPVIGDNTEDTRRFYNGTVLEAATLTVASDGVTCTVAVENTLNPADPLSLMFNEEFNITTAPHTATLTAGTDIVPVRNWVYFSEATETLTVSLTGFPNTEQFVPVADIIVQSAASAATDGFYKVHAWTDHISGTNGQGHLSHINEWIRNRPAAWQSGCSVTPTVAEDVYAANIYLQYTSGVVYQLHRHAMPVFDNSGGDEFLLYNDPTTPYKVIPSLNATDIFQDTNSGTLINKSFNLVVWGVVSEDPSDCQVLINLPTGSYTTDAAAIADASAYTSYSLPETYRGCAFLLHRIVCRIQGGQIKILSGGVFDLRGVVPSASGGGSSGGGGVVNFTELLDTPASYAGAALDVVRVNAGENALEFYDPANWDTAYDKRLDSLTTTGASGSSTLIANVLNVPSYTLAGLGGQVAGDYAVLNSTSDNNSDYLYISRSNTAPVFYANQRSTGDIARFMYRATDATSSADQLTITNTAGLTTTDKIQADGSITSGTGTGADDQEYFRFQSDRPWVFKQKDTGASTALELQSLNDKFFYITDSVRNIGFSFRPATGDFVATGDIQGVNVAGTTSVNAGISDSAFGSLRAYGNGAGSQTGGLMQLYTAADHDTTYEYFRFWAVSDDLYIGTSADFDGGAIYSPAQTQWNFQANSIITTGDLECNNATFGSIANASTTLQIDTSAVGSGIINFGDVSSTTMGRIIYDHTTNILEFYANGGLQVQVGEQIIDLKLNDTITGGDITVSGVGVVTSPEYYCDNTNTRNKISVWNSMSYSIGMAATFTFGSLNDYAMTFQMNSTTDRGWWWGTTSHTTAQGAAALNIDGEFTLAGSIRAGYGTSDTSAHTAGLGLDITGSGFISNDLTVNGTLLAANTDLSAGGDFGLFATTTTVPALIMDTYAGVFFDRTANSMTLGVNGVLDTLDMLDLNATAYTIDAGTNHFRTGSVFLADGGISPSGLAFGTSIVAANTLDDYEEGTWTPSLTGSTSGTYTTAAGFTKLAYTKVGRVVHIQGRIRITAESSPSGRIRMTLPFTVWSGASDTESVSWITAQFWLNGHTLTGQAILACSVGFARGDFYMISLGGILTNLTQDYVDTDWYLQIEGSYIAD